MKRILLATVAIILAGFGASAQKVSTRVVDNKGTIKWVLDSTTAVITKADSTILYVTPTQLKDSFAKVVKYSDTAGMLGHYVNDGNNGLTKTGQTLQLGGDLIKPTVIKTTATNFLAITGLTSGSNTTDSVVVVDTAGQLKFISASSLFNALTFSNGLTKTGNKVELGGDLTKPTTIKTDATNVLKVPGLQNGSLSTDSIVVAASDGTLKKVGGESLLQSGDTSFIATPGQTDFSVVGMPANVSKVWVYRNGAKLVGGTTNNPAHDYSVIAGLLTLIPNTVPPNDWSVKQGDVIEIQWVK